MGAAGHWVGRVFGSGSMMDEHRKRWAFCIDPLGHALSAATRRYVSFGFETKTKVLGPLSDL
jgi:hypothetical protein